MFDVGSSAACKELRNEELGDWYWASNSIKVTKSKIITWALIVASMEGEMKREYRWEKVDSPPPLGRPSCRWQNNTEMDLREVG
jgi:hypothetical protein